MTGTLINTGAIVFGGLAGLLFGKRLRDRHQETLTMACGVGTLFIGISAAMNYMLHNDLFPDGGAMLVIICLALGGLIGEMLNITEAAVSDRIRKAKQKLKQELEGGRA